MKKFSKIILSLFLSLSMFSTSFAYAEGNEGVDEETQIEVLEEEEDSIPEEIYETDTKQLTETKETAEIPSEEPETEESDDASTRVVIEGDTVVSEVPVTITEENVVESTDVIEAEVKENEEISDDIDISSYDFGNLDFSSKRLIIQTFNPAVFDEETPIISQFNNAYLIQYDSEENAKKAYVKYKDMEDILTIEPDNTSFELDEGENGDSEEIIMTEDENPFDSLKAELETPIQRTPKLKVAIIDSGIAENMANEYVDFTNSSTVYDENGHGTRMAEIIKDYSYGNAYIISVKAFDGFGHSSSSIMYSAITYAMEQDVNVINISASANDSEDAELLKQAILLATQRGISVVGSAGNRNIDASGRIPVNVNEVIGVTSLNENKEITGGYGNFVDLGVIASSTSEATAIVSGSIIAKKLGLKNKTEIYTIDSNGTSVIDVVDEESNWELDCADWFYGDVYYWALPYGATTTAEAVRLTQYEPARGQHIENYSCSRGGSFCRIKWNGDLNGCDSDDLQEPDRSHTYASYVTTRRYCSVLENMGHNEDGDLLKWNGSRWTITNNTNVPNYDYVGYIKSQGIGYSGNNLPGFLPPGQPGPVAVSSLKTSRSLTAQVGEGGVVMGTTSCGGKTCAMGAPDGISSYYSGAWRMGGFRVDFYYKLAGYPLTINYYEEGTTTKVYDTVVQPHPEGDNYSVASPNGREKGYRITRAFFKTDNVPYANKDLISGTMPAKALEYDVFYKKTNLRVTKAWNGDIEPTSVNFVILDSSGNQYKTGTLTAANNWTTVVERVDYGKTYSIYESNLNTNNYTSTCTASHPCTISTDETSNTTDIYRAVTITNRRINEITVNKEWTEEAGDTSDRPESFKVHLIDMNTKQDVLPAATLNAGNGWSYTWKDVSIDIATINYGVWEEVPDLYDCPNFDANSAKPVTKTAGKKSFATVLLTNEYTPVFPKHKNVFNTDNVNIDNEIVRNGDTLKYVITFTNPTGMEKKFDIEDVIPENSEFVSAENGGTLDGNKVSWKNIAVPGRGTGSVTFYVMAIGDRNHYVTIENTAQVWMIKKDGRRVITDKPDPETGIKSPDTETRHNYVPPTTAGPEGSIKSVTDVFNVDINTEYVEKDDNLYYHILVNNGTPLNKTFTVTDKIPENTEFVSVGEYGTFANNTVTFVKEIPAKSRQEFTFVVKTLKDYSDIINIANVAVDHVNWDTNTVTNKTAKIVINKSISNYYESFGKPSFTYEIKGSDGQVAYRMIELDNAVNGTAEFTVPRYTKDNVTFTVDEIRNGRYDFQALGTDTPNTTTLQNSLANIKFTEGNRLSVLNYQNIINEWDKNSHADSVTNKVRRK